MSVRQTKDWEDVDRQTRKFINSLPCFWPVDWVSDSRNYALIDDRENIGLFDYNPSGYEGHMYFNSRGKEAIASASEMIQWFFDNTQETEIIGKTPILCKGAWMLARKLGFKRIGVIAGEFGPMYHSRLTKSEWDNRSKPDD